MQHYIPRNQRAHLLAVDGSETDERYTLFINSRPQHVPKTGVVISTVISTTVTKLHCKNNDHTSAISHSNSVAETTYEWLIYI